MGRLIEAKSDDLISRQELLKLFVNLRDEHETASISYNALYELILKQPTAYDIEKVVARNSDWKH